MTFTLLGIGIWGLTELETKFESSWFLPQDSYVAKWLRYESNQNGFFFFKYFLVCVALGFCRRKTCNLIITL